MDRRQFIESTVLMSLGVGLQHFSQQEKTHLLTLSFDDGFRKSFYRIAEIHETYGLKACLNVIAMGHEKGLVQDHVFYLENLPGIHWPLGLIPCDRLKDQGRARIAE